MGENPEWEDRVFGKSKELLAKEGPGGNELVVVWGFMEEDLGSTVLKIIFGACFVDTEGLGLATEEDRMSITNKSTAVFQLRNFA